MFKRIVSYLSVYKIVGNYLELYDVRDGKLFHIDTLTLTGSIKSMEVVRIPNQTQDSIIVLTEREFFCILAYDSNNKKVQYLIRVYRYYILSYY